MSEQPKQVTVEELTARCGHECLKQPDHDGQHFYGYQMGPHSYEGLLTSVRAMRAIVDAMVVHEPYFSHEGLTVCSLCDATVSEELDDEHKQHLDGCPYRMAGEFHQTLRVVGG